MACSGPIPCTMAIVRETNPAFLDPLVPAVIESVAAANPKVLNHPPPQAFFFGFGDSWIDFELWAWTDRFDDWIQIRSELGVAVYRAVRAAGFSFPFPPG